MEKQVPVDIVQFHACTGMQEEGGGGGRERGGILHLNL